MRIDFHSGPQTVADTNHASAQSSNASTRSPANSGEDQAQLSGASSQVAALTSQASQLPEVREERVQALREAVEYGRYRPDAEKIAAAMLGHMILGPAA